LESTTPVQTPATIDPTEIRPHFYLRNRRQTPTTAEIEKWLRVLDIRIFWLQIRVQKINA